MKPLRTAPLTTIVFVAALAGCAAAPPSPAPAPAPGTAFTGEVWTWDEEAGTVTLRQVDRVIRVKISPDQLDRLELHRIVTVQGELAPPATVERVLPPPAAFVPRGPADEAQLGGRLSAIDPLGAVTVDTPKGALRLWLATPGAVTFRAGDAVLVGMRVQPLVPVTPTEAPRPAPPPPAVQVGREPGDYASVRGPVRTMDRGRLVIDSPRGPVTVWVPSPARYQVGDWVEVRTSIHPAR